jgi:excisionase family DNA binding protein
MNVNEKIALNVSEVAELLGVSRPVVYQLIHREDFPAFKIGKRTLVPRLALEEWANRQKKIGL